MTKKNLMVDEQSEKDYVPFIVNRGLGYFQDTVLLANEMNVNCHIDSKLQYDFLKSTVSKRKRFSKWLKAEDDEKVDIIRKYFGYNHTVAKSVSHLFSMEQLNTIKKRLDKGGHSKR
tara:strand:- start:460 stop:810 length:351 start_codon:yes stop_codon:yes gene_type:complete